MGRSIKCPKCQLWFSAEKYSSCPHCVEIAEEQAIKKAKEKVITDAVVAYLRSEDAAKKEVYAKAAVEDAAEREAAAKEAVLQAAAEKKAAEMMAAAAADTAAVQKEEARKALLASGRAGRTEELATWISTAKISAEQGYAGTGASRTNYDRIQGLLHTQKEELVPSGKSFREPEEKKASDFIMPEFLQPGRKIEISPSMPKEPVKKTESFSSLSNEPERSTLSQRFALHGKKEEPGNIPESITAAKKRQKRRADQIAVSGQKEAKLTVTFEPTDEDPVTMGWLVGIAGSGYGKNLPLYQGRNLIYVSTDGNPSPNTGIKPAGRSSEKQTNGAGLSSGSPSPYICAVIMTNVESQMAVYPGIAGSSCHCNGNKVEGEVVLSGYDYLIFDNDPQCAYIYVSLVNSIFDWGSFTDE